MSPREEAVLMLAASKEFELGKFFFGVATATIGFLLTAEKMNATPEWTGLLVFGLVLIVLAMIVAVYMTLVSPFTASTNFFTKFLAKVDPKAWTCFLLWLIGTAVGVAAVLPS
jgi:hypothetical protein